MTDDSGGRTEIRAVQPRSRPGNASFADELSQQGNFSRLPAPPQRRTAAGTTIRVEVRDKRYQVRARRGYMAS